MYQQMDCAIDREHVSSGNPTGCLHDLQSAITTTFATRRHQPPQVPRDTGQTMAFFNMQQGDAPLFKSLADQYTMSDNYHQPVMGGTGPDSQSRSASPIRCSSATARSRQRRDPAGLADLQPEPGGRGLQQRQLQSLHVAQPVVQLLRRERARHQADPRLSGEAPLRGVAELPGRRTIYNAVNVDPALTPGGTPQGGTIVPQQTIRSIGDVLSSQEHPVEVLRRRLQSVGREQPDQRLLQHLQSVRVSGQLSGDAAPITCAT